MVCGRKKEEMGSCDDWRQEEFVDLTAYSLLSNGKERVLIPTATTYLKYRLFFSSEPSNFYQYFHFHFYKRQERSTPNSWLIMSSLFLCAIMLPCPNQRIRARLCAHTRGRAFWWFEIQPGITIYYNFSRTSQPEPGESTQSRKSIYVRFNNFRACLAHPCQHVAPRKLQLQK